MEGTLGEIRMFGGTFAPLGWRFCHGQHLDINQYTVMFALLGTIYGGDGRFTFALPDFRGRIPVGEGDGPGLRSYDLGEMGGQEGVTLTSIQMPPHVHGAVSNIAATFSPKVSSSAAGNVASAEGNYLSVAAANMYGSTADENMSATAVTAGVGGSISLGPTGNNLPHDNIQPVTCLNYIICVEGIFPSRN